MDSCPELATWGTKKLNKILKCTVAKSVYFLGGKVPQNIRFALTILREINSLAKKTVNSYIWCIHFL